MPPPGETRLGKQFYTKDQSEGCPVLTLGKQICILDQSEGCSVLKLVMERYMQGSSRMGTS